VATKSGEDFKTILSRAKKERTLAEANWYLNYAFYLGYHNVNWQASWGGTGKFVFVQNRGQSSEISISRNYFFNWARTYSAKLMPDMKLDWIVSSEDGDDKASRVGKALLQNWWENVDNGVQSVIGLAVQLLPLMPVYLHIYPVKTGSALTDTGEEIADYDCNVELLSPFDVWIMPGQTHSVYEAVSGYIVRRRISLAEAENRWGPEVARNMGIASESDTDPLVQLALQGDAAVTGPLHIGDGQVVFYEVWEKGTSGNPSRVCLYTVDGVLLEEREWSFPFLPFVRIVERDGIGPYPAETARQIREIQIDLNRQYSRLSQYVRLHAFPRMIVPYISINPKQKITADPRQILHLVAGGQPPTYMQLPPPSASLFSIITADLNDIERIGGLSEVSSRGIIPSRANTLGQTQSIIQLDIERVNVTRFLLEKGIAHLGKMYLAYARRLFILPKMVKIVGYGKKVFIDEFTKEDLSDEYTVQVSLASRIGKDLSTRLQLAQALTGGAPFLNPQEPADRRALMHLLEVGNEDDIDPQALQRAIAEKENDIMREEKKLVNVNDWDDDRVHLEVHTAAIAEASLSDIDAGTVSLLEAHRNLHLAKVRAALMQMQEGGMMNASDGVRRAK
jgi:hypothetical protein